MPLTSREAALKTLFLLRKREARPEIVLDTMAKRGELQERDIPLAYRITNGVIQNKTLCDYYIGCYCATPVKKLEYSVLDILRCSVYQLLFLDGIPDRAAVNEGVSLTKKYSPRASGLVNAVLRKISDNIDKLPEIKSDTPEEYLSIKYSHPLWLVKKLMEQYGDSCESILRENNTEPPTTIQTNTLKITSDSLLKELRTAKRHPIDENALIIDDGFATHSSSFENGHFYVQDESAKLAVTAAGIKSGMRVIDLCAAPGGKSFAAAIAMKNIGEIAAYDIHKNKIQTIKDGAERLGIDIISTFTADAKVLSAKSADVVLADVPCSGIGVIRKKPEIRNKSPEEIKKLPALQLAILQNASKLVKSGGIIVYSTCTILKEENENVIASFLNGNKSYVKEHISLPKPYSGENGFVTILPDEYMDGFFICTLRNVT